MAEIVPLTIGRERIGRTPRRRLWRAVRKRVPGAIWRSRRARLATPSKILRRKIDLARAFLEGSGKQNMRQVRQKEVEEQV